MKNCLHCASVIDPDEIYGDWFHCLGCGKNFEYQPERSSPEDHFVETNEMICDDPNYGYINETVEIGRND